MNSVGAKHRLQWPQWLAAFGASSVMFNLDRIDIVWMNKRGVESSGFVIGIYTTLVVLGAFIGAIFADKFGRKNTLLMMLPLAIPYGVNSPFDSRGLSWTTNFILDCFLKFSSGITCTLVPLYIAEISNTNNRGSLMVMQLPIVQAGVVASYTTAMFFQNRYRYFNEGNLMGIILLFVPIFIHAMILGVCPETPQYLNWKKSYHDTAQSLAFYRRINHVKIRDNPTSPTANVDGNKKAQGCIGRFCNNNQSENCRKLGMIFFLIIIKLITGIRAKEETLVFMVSRYTLSSPYLLSSVGIHLAILCYFTAIFIFSVFVMFAIGLFEHKLSLLLAIVGSLTATIVEATIHLDNTLIFCVIQHICHLIFIAATLSYVGKLFSINRRAIALASTISFDIVCRSLISYTKSLMLQNFGTHFFIEELCIHGAVCVAAIFFVLLFFPKTNKMDTDIWIETSNGIECL